MTGHDINTYIENVASRNAMALITDPTMTRIEGQMNIDGVYVTFTVKYTTDKKGVMFIADTSNHPKAKMAVAIQRFDIVA